MKWARFFRIVNLPTVPGDVLAGAAVLWCESAANFAECNASGGSVGAVFAAALASVFLYMFGLADNDIAGAKTDKGRPIPDGEISMTAARVAAFACLAAAAATGCAARLPAPWGMTAFLLVCCIVAYNRTKRWWLMGLCRGLNVICGGAACCGAMFCRDSASAPRLVLLGTALVWTAYVAWVTKYSEGEEADEAKKRRVGVLVGAIAYLQLTVLLIFPVKPFLLAGAAMLVLLRLMKKLLPEVSAS